MPGMTSLLAEMAAGDLSATRMEAPLLPNCSWELPPTPNLGSKELMPELPWEKEQRENEQPRDEELLHQTLVPQESPLAAAAPTMLPSSDRPAPSRSLRSAAAAAASRLTQGSSEETSAEDIKGATARPPAPPVPPPGTPPMQSGVSPMRRFTFRPGPLLGGDEEAVDSDCAKSPSARKVHTLSGMLISQKVSTPLGGSNANSPDHWMTEEQPSMDPEPEEVQVMEQQPVVELPGGISSPTGMNSAGLPPVPSGWQQRFGRPPGPAVRPGPALEADIDLEDTLTSSHSQASEGSNSPVASRKKASLGGLAVSSGSALASFKARVKPASPMTDANGVKPKKPLVVPHSPQAFERPDVVTPPPMPPPSPSAARRAAPASAILMPF